MILSKLLLVTVSPDSALPRLLTLIWPVLPSVPLLITALPVKSISPLSVTVLPVTVAWFSVSLPVLSTVMLPPPFATVVSWSRVRAPSPRTSIPPVLVTVSPDSALPRLLTLIWPVLPSVPLLITALPVKSISPLSVTVPPVTVAWFSVSLPVLSTVMLPPPFATVVSWSRVRAPSPRTSIPPVLVTVSPDSALPRLLTLIWPVLPSVPLLITALPVKSISPLSVTVPPVTVAWFSVSLPVLSTVMLPPPFATVVSWSRVRAPSPRTSIPPVLVTVSPDSALPRLLTLIWPVLPSVPLLITALPVKSISPLSVTVPPVTVAWFSVSLPVLSTVMLPPPLATVVSWSRVRAPSPRTSIPPVLVTVSPDSALPRLLTLIWPVLPSVPLLITALPVKSISPLSVTVPPVTVAWFSVSLPVLSTVMLPPPLATVVSWSRVRAPSPRTSIPPVLVTVSPDSALPRLLTLIWPVLPSVPLLITALPVKSISPLSVTVPPVTMAWFS